MFDAIKNIIVAVASNEAERQNAIARFGASNPSSPTQIRPQDITGGNLFKLLKSSVTSDDSIGLRMRKGGPGL